MNKINSLQNQKGFLTLISVVLIVIVGFIAVALAYITFENAFGSSNIQNAGAALYEGESGLENATHKLLTPTIANRVACAGLSISNTLGNGAFSVTSTGRFYVTSPTTVNGALTATAVTIPVVSTSGYQGSGRIMIDHELINYNSITATSFIGLTRGVDGSLASAHSSGTLVGQNQCGLSSQGGVPNLNTPTNPGSPGGKRIVTESVELQDGWTVGNVSGTKFVLTHWNEPTELSWNDASLTNGSAASLTGVSMLSNVEGWAVGGTEILHLLKTAWTASAAPTYSCGGGNLNAVSSVSSHEAWAVGNVNATALLLCLVTIEHITIIQWNGSSWSVASGIPSGTVNLQDVAVIDSTGSGTGNIGFAVGTSGTILQYNGSSWTNVSSPVATTLNSVFIVSATEAWAVGASGKILKWNGANWSSVASPTTASLNGIAMMDTTGSGTASTGYIVGNGGVALIYNGASWSLQNIGGSNNYWDVAVEPQGAWAVGDNGSIVHWDGNSWTSVASNESVTLNAIDMVSPRRMPFAGWQETIA